MIDLCEWFLSKRTIFMLSALNPNCSGRGGGCKFSHISVLTSLLLKSNLFSFWIEIFSVFVMAKAVSNTDICFIKSVLLLCYHRNFHWILRRIAYLPPHTIRVKIIDLWYTMCQTKNTSMWIKEKLVTSGSLCCVQFS